MFDWENAIALDTVQGNRASSPTEGKVSWVFSSFGRNMVYMHHSFLIHSSADGHLGCFPVLAIICLIGKTQLLWTQCRGIGPHLTGREKSHVFSRVAAGTREYTPGACCNSRKPMRLSPPCGNSRKHMRLFPPGEMRPDSTALCPEQLRFPNQTCKEPRFA